MTIDNTIMTLAGVVTTGVADVLAVRREKAERSNWRCDQCPTAYSDVLKACTAIHFENNGCLHG
jgi:hypothetical protein